MAKQAWKDLEVAIEDFWKAFLSSDSTSLEAFCENLEDVRISKKFLEIFLSKFAATSAWTVNEDPNYEVPKRLMYAIKKNLQNQETKEKKKQSKQAKKEKAIVLVDGEHVEEPEEVEDTDQAIEVVAELTEEEIQKNMAKFLKQSDKKKKADKIARDKISDMHKRDVEAQKLEAQITNMKHQFRGCYKDELDP